MTTPISARSTAAWFVHFGGEVISGIEAGRGVILPAATTSATPLIEPFGDDANIGISIKGKGTGAQTFGGSSGTCAIGGSAIRANAAITLSTGVAVKGVYSTSFSWTNAALSSGQTAEVTISTNAVTLNGATAPEYGDIVSITLGTSNASAAMMYGGFRLSTVGTSAITVIIGNPGSSASSTLGSANGWVSWVDLT